MEPILTVEHLSISFTRYGRWLSRVELRPIRDLSLTVEPGLEHQTRQKLGQQMGQDVGPGGAPPGHPHPPGHLNVRRLAQLEHLPRQRGCP